MVFNKTNSEGQLSYEDFEKEKKVEIVLPQEEMCTVWCEIIYPFTLK